MKKEIIFIAGFILVCLISLNFISAININEKAETNVIIPEFNQPAKINLEITGVSAGSYNIYTLTDVQIKPTSPFKIDAENKNMEIYIYPTEALNVKGLYTFTYTINGPEQYNGKMTIKIVNLKDAVEIGSGANDPSTGKIKFFIRNKENAKLENIKARFSSILFNEEKTFSLNPVSDTEITFDVDDAKLRITKAGSYVIKAEFETDRGIQTVEGKFYIGEKEGLATEEKSSGLLINTKTITKINSGNLEENINIKIRKNIFSRLFTTFNIEPLSVERGIFFVEYLWGEKLEPGEVFEVKAKSNYIFPFLIAIFAGLVILGFSKYSKAKIEVEKSVSHVKTKGGEFALRVRINVRARVKSDNVSLIDKIPAIVKVYEKFGTVRPDKIDSANRRLRWDLGELNAGEERAFSYIIYSKVGVVGKFSLPEALVVFEKDGEIHEIESNKVFFLSEQIRKED